MPDPSPMVTRRCRRAHRLTVLLAAAGLALGACGGTTHSTTPGTASSTSVPGPTSTTTGAGSTTAVRWTPCTGAAGPSGYQCATVPVPLDEEHPGAATIGIALDRRPAGGTRIGVLLVNPGGPGASGVDFLPDVVAEMPASVLEHFDVVGFDPRGVDRSDPVTCGTGAQLDAELGVDPAPTTAAGMAALLSEDRRFVDGCEARSGALLAHVGTVDAARDLDRIRADLGQSRLDYLGFSYGTLLGAVYAGLFPTHVGRMVLDGALDPALGPIPLVTAQSASLDAEWRAWAASCDAGRCGWSPTGGAAAAFVHLVDAVRAHPVVVAGTGRSVGPAQLLYGAAAALYSPATWPDLGAAMAQLASGDGRDILALFDSYVGRNADGTYANTVEAETAVDCLDGTQPTLAQLRAAAPGVAARAPVFGLLDLYSDVTCSLWPVAPTMAAAPIRAAGSPAIVVVGTTGDPVTPYAWAQALAGQLAHGVLVTRVGEGHTGYGYSSCVRGLVDTYLLTGTPPPGGSRCDP